MPPVAQGPPSTGGAGDNTNSSVPSGIKKIDASGSGQVIVHPDEEISLVRLFSDFFP